MKRLLVVVGLLFMGLAALHAQDQSYRIVFDLTSRDSLDQRAVMRWVKGIATSDPNAEVEVVMYGKGFELVMPGKSGFVAEVKEAAKNPRVSFKVCEMALKNNKVEKTALVAEAQTVPDGIYEILMKQRQGWGYIKVAH